jgi:8-oxo-dGTP pyrophosphatase MutT (NUDIX family)
VSLRGADKTDLRTQFAALCYRFKREKLQICLITSRGTGRWILPKGWPMHKQTPAEAAATEAWEEAGLTGKARDASVGTYSYIKLMKDQDLPIMTLVYPLEVKKVHDDWPEKNQRRRKWFSPKKAAKKVDEQELSLLLAAFDPKALM